MIKIESQKTVTRETTFWIVDYDLPANSSRRQFYRELRRYREEHKLMDGSGWSTQQKVERELAKLIEN